MRSMATTIHISEADAARDFTALLKRVRDGVEVVIESGTEPVAVLRSPEAPISAFSASEARTSNDLATGFRPRLLSESIALAKKRAIGRTEEPRMNPEFAAELEEILDHRKPWSPPAWE
jgi:antitoxin (DNA-binding transcriptional repressor) of toxin-antitoxin stability system